MENIEQCCNYTVNINQLPKYVETADDETPVEIATNSNLKVWVLSPSKKWRTCYILDEKRKEDNIEWLMHYNGFHTQYDEWMSSKSNRISLTKPINVIPWWISSYAVPTIGFVYNLKANDQYKILISSINNLSLQNDIHIQSQLLTINGNFVTDLGSNENVNTYLDKAANNLHSKNIDISLEFKIDKKLLMEKGVHLQFDVTFDTFDEINRFPYYKFTKEKIQSMMELIFEEQVKVYQIYGNDTSKGVSILLFVYINDEKIHKFERETQTKHLTRQQLIVNGYVRENINFMIPLDVIQMFHRFYSQQKAYYKTIILDNKAQRMQDTMKELISYECIVKYVQQRYGIKVDRLDKGYANIAHVEYMKEKRSLMNLIYSIKGRDEGRDAWYLVLVDPDQFKHMACLLKQPVIHLDAIGYILRSAYGTSPSTADQNICFDTFDFNKD